MSTDPNPSPAPAGPPPAIESTTEERQLAMLAHIGGIPTSFIAPLVIYLMKKDQSPFLADQAKEALNFQLNLLVILIVGIPLMFVVIGIPIVLAAAVGNVVLSIMAAMQANEGKVFRHRYLVRVIQ
ncbi:MAG: DUF4870 domain-containing protein [Planctomycetia bacterium]|nr:DUF4870 domain-containing protein [Planctomycetia bacterium]